MDSGRTQERMKEIINIFKTLLANRSLIQPNPSFLKTLTDKATSLLPIEILATVIPKPKQTLMAVIKIFLSLHPISEIDFIPTTAMVPSKMTIVPPITASGME